MSVYLSFLHKHATPDLILSSWDSLGKSTKCVAFVDWVGRPCHPQLVFNSSKLRFVWDFLLPPFLGFLDKMILCRSPVCTIEKGAPPWLTCGQEPTTRRGESTHKPHATCKADMVLIFSLRGSVIISFSVWVDFYLWVWLLLWFMVCGFHLPSQLMSLAAWEVE